MTHLINVKEVVEDGQIYVVEEYSSGAIVKYVKPAEGTEPDVPQPSETDQTVLETAINTEYLVCLADLGL